MGYVVCVIFSFSLLFCNHLLFLNGPENIFIFSVSVFLYFAIYGNGRLT